MALFSTGNQMGTGGLDPYIQSLAQSNPAAYKAYQRYLELKIASLNDPDEGGSTTRAARRAQRRRIGYSDAALAEAQQNLEQNYPAIWQYNLANQRAVGGLGQGGDEIATMATIIGGGIAAGGTGAATGGSTAGGAATGGAAGGGAAAGGAGGATGGAAGGAAGGAGYSGLTDTAIETGITGGLGSSGGSGGGGGGGGGANTGTGSSGGGFWDSLGNFIGSDTGQGLLNLGSGYLQNQQNQQAADKYAQAQIEAARIAAEAARFKPVGVTTRFGQSNFKFDDKGNLVSAGYTLSPEMKAQQDAIMGAITGNRSQGMMQPQNSQPPQNRQQPIGTLPNGQPNYQYSIGMPQNPNQQGMFQIAGARANGGPVAGGQTYLVGERGPEQFNSPYGSTIVGQNGPSLFTPPASGGIVPNERLSYAGGTPGFYNANVPNQQLAVGQAPSNIAQETLTSPLNSIGVPANPNNQNLSLFTPSAAYGGVVGNTNSNINNPINPNNQNLSLYIPPSAYPAVTGNNGNQQTTPGLLGQAVNAQETTAPLSQGSQSLFNLGQGYLATSPQEQAARYMQEQQALLAPSRERGLAQLQNQMHQQGRTGLATGGTSTMGAANPELEAFYNAQRQQDLALASQATQGGQQYAQFGAGLLGTGGEMLRNMYGTQSAAYQPYQTALGMMTGIEGLGQNAMDIGINLGSSGANAGANIGRMLQQGYGNAAEGRRQADQYSPWANLLQGASTWY